MIYGIKVTFSANMFRMPLSYVVYGSLAFVVITLVLFLVSKKKKR